MKICLIDSGMFVRDEDLIEPLKKIGSVFSFDDVPKDLDEAVERAKEAEIVIFSLMQISNEMLDKLPKLKILQFIGTGVTNFVDVDYANSLGIKVLNIEAYGNNAVAEFAVSMGMNLAKNIILGNYRLKSKIWDIDALEGFEIAGSTVGVLGTGNIGELVAKKYVALGANVIACDLYPNVNLQDNYNVKYMSMEDVFANSDLVSVHLRLTPESEGYIDENILSKAKHGCCLVNVARAELVERTALIMALDKGLIKALATDVYNSEPPTEDDYEIVKRENVVATPHIAYYTKQASDNSVRLAVQSVLSALN